MYIQVDLFVSDATIREMLIALLADAGYEGFEETDDMLSAYIPGDMFDQAVIDTLAANEAVGFSIKKLEKQNWNHEWEKNFEPVVVDGFCLIRADFHPAQPGIPYEIVITPKMSFGTGHHATTQLMVMEMQQVEFKGKAVLDFGTGTGILAILAEMMEAATIMAIDNDEWAYENAKDNLLRNQCERTELLQGSIEALPARSFDVILANINRHILLQYMPDLFDRLNKDGQIIMSGLLKEDRELIVEKASQTGFRLVKDNSKGNWISLLFKNRRHNIFKC